MGCWASRDEGYLFLVGVGGHYVIMRQSEKTGERTGLAVSEPGAVPTWRQPTRIEGDCIGGGSAPTTLVMRINGKEVAVAKDRKGLDSFSGFGFFVNSDVPADVGFDDFLAQQVPTADAAKALAEPEHGTGIAGYPDGLSHLWVCRGEYFDSENNLCRRNERGRPISATSLYCAVRFGGSERSGRKFTGRLTFDGSPVQESTQKLHFSPDNVSAGTGDGSRLLPAGTWTCEFAMGQDKVDATFRTAGSSAPWVGNLSVCLTRKTDRNHNCPADRTVPFSRPRSVTCNADFIGVKGRRLGFKVGYGTREEDYGPVPTDGGATSSLWADVTPEFVPGASGDELPSGNYACRFLVAGKQLAEKAFSVR